jgi:hypothetical protein
MSSSELKLGIGQQRSRIRSMRIGECMEEEDMYMYEFCCFAFALPVRILDDISLPTPSTSWP